MYSHFVMFHGRGERIHARMSNFNLILCTDLGWIQKSSLRVYICVRLCLRDHTLSDDQVYKSCVYKRTHKWIIPEP